MSCKIQPQTRPDLNHQPKVYLRIWDVQYNLVSEHSTITLISCQKNILFQLYNWLKMNITQFTTIIQLSSQNQRKKIWSNYIAESMFLRMNQFPLMQYQKCCLLLPRFVFQRKYPLEILETLLLATTRLVLKSATFSRFDGLFFTRIPFQQYSNKKVSLVRQKQDVLAIVKVFCCIVQKTFVPSRLAFFTIPLRIACRPHINGCVSRVDPSAVAHFSKLLDA